MRRLLNHCWAQTTPTTRSGRLIAVRSHSLPLESSGRSTHLAAPRRRSAKLPAATAGRGSRDGVIVIAPTVPSSLYRVSSSGGVAAPLTELDLAHGEITHRDPIFLPDSHHFLFFVQGTEGKQGIYLGSLDTKNRPLLLAGTSSAAYAPPGYLLFVREGTLMAQRFDPDNFTLAGEAAPVAAPVGFYNASTGTFSVSDNGVLVHSVGNTADQRQLAWFDRSGKLVERIGSTVPLSDVALSPDHKRAAVQGGNNDIWVVDLVRGGIPSRLTFDATVEDWPVWPPDGQVLFNSTIGGAGAAFLGTTRPLITGWKVDRVHLGRVRSVGSVRPEFSTVRGEVAGLNHRWLHPTLARGRAGTLYLTLDRKIMSVEVKSALSAFEVQQAKPLFVASIDVVSAAAGNRFDVTADGERFLINAPVENTTSASLGVVIIINWTAALKR
jgi:hypothetical protein